MDNKEEGSINKTPIMDDTNYDYWKAHVVAFLKSIDSKTWKAIVKGQNHPMDSQKEGASTTLNLKKEEDWTKEEDE